MCVLMGYVLEVCSQQGIRGVCVFSWGMYLRCAVSRALGVCVLMRYVLEVCSQQGIRGVCVLMRYVLEVCSQQGIRGVCSHEVCT